MWTVDRPTRESMKVGTSFSIVTVTVFPVVVTSDPAAPVPPAEDR